MENNYNKLNKISSLHQPQWKADIQPANFKPNDLPADSIEITAKKEKSANKGFLSKLLRQFTRDDKEQKKETNQNVGNSDSNEDTKQTVKSYNFAGLNESEKEKALYFIDERNLEQTVALQLAKLNFEKGKRIADILNQENVCLNEAVMLANYTDEEVQRILKMYRENNLPFSAAIQIGSLDEDKSQRVIKYINNGSSFNDAIRAVNLDEEKAVRVLNIIQTKGVKYNDALQLSVINDDQIDSAINYTETEDLSLSSAVDLASFPEEQKNKVLYYMHSKGLDFYPAKKLALMDKSKSEQVLSLSEKENISILSAIDLVLAGQSAVDLVVNQGFNPYDAIKLSKYDVNKRDNIIELIKTKGLNINAAIFFTENKCTSLIENKEHADKVQNLGKYGISLKTAIDLAANEKQYEFVTGLTENGYDIYSALYLKDFMYCRNVSDVNELSLQERKDLLRNLMKNQNSSQRKIYELNIPEDMKKVIPSSKEEYCRLLQKLSNSIGISSKSLSEKDLQIFFEGLKNIIRDIKITNPDEITIALDYSGDEFVNEVSELIKQLDSSQKKKIADYFGFEIKQGQIIGYPVNVYDEEKLSEIKDEDTIKVIEEVNLLVQKFCNNNISIPENKLLEDDFNKIIQGLNELITIIGRKQHKGHDYTLDIHTLKVLKYVVEHPRFEKLSESDKMVLTISALLHDITKKEGAVDKMHAEESAFDAYYIIQKLKLSEDEQLKIYELIKTHDWFKKLNKAGDNIEIQAGDIAFELRHSNTFELSKILCEADLKSVKRNESYYNNFAEQFLVEGDLISNYLKRLTETQIFLPVTKMPKASELRNCSTESAEGITNTVFYINKADDDLSLYGFEAGTTKDNWRNLIHAFDDEMQMSNLTTLSVIDSDALLSSSYITPDNYKVFKKQGFIIDVHPDNMHAGYYIDFGSDCKKDLELLKRDYLFYDSASENTRENRTKYRDYISYIIKTQMKINTSQYIEYMNKIEGCKSIVDIEKKDKAFASELQKITAKLTPQFPKPDGRSYNEILISRPKIKAVFSYGQSYEEIPLFLRKYAQEHDLPVIIFSTEQEYHYY